MGVIFFLMHRDGWGGDLFLLYFIPKLSEGRVDMCLMTRADHCYIG